MYALSFFAPNLSKLKSYAAQVSLVGLSLIMVGCTTLGPHSGSLASRSATLSNGLQRAYSVPKTTADRVSPMSIQSADKQDMAP